MDISESVLEMYEDILKNISNKNNVETSLSSSIEEIFNPGVEQEEYKKNNNDNNEELNNNDHDVELHGYNKHHQTRINIFEMMNTSTSNKPKLIKINEININIDFPCKHPKRTYTNSNGVGEISTWDLSDDTSAINLVGFNLDSYTMSNKLVEGKSYEFGYLSIRTVDNMYKKLSHEYQLLVNNATNVREISMSYNYEMKYNFTDLNEIETLPFNSIIDVQVTVLRDYGITAGNTNGNSWMRRELHVGQNGVNIKLTLWNEQAKVISTSVIQKSLKIKYVKIDYFNGLRTLVSMGNTRLTIASTTEKISYHLIHANPSILFQNTTTLRIFMKTIIHSLLLSIIQHKCTTFNINLTVLECASTSNLINQLVPFVNTLRKHCNRCNTSIPFVSIADIAYLLVQNKTNQWTLAIDTNVYSKNQQLRLFESVKYGKNNPLVLSTKFPFHSEIKYSYSNLLKKSLIIFMEHDIIPKIYLKDKNFVVDLYSISNPINTLS
ncbi:unnamed protein product [Rotaria magnacalcarata]|uniref:DNA-directed primase/polymerase protein n=7 Tax=Rotaria magnacalcarata TaxID=392030 RepID=A0A816XIX3_9BILA|nr:unnamed protein product [Rotaria magnacalcarata]